MTVQSQRVGERVEVRIVFGDYDSFRSMGELVANLRDLSELLAVSYLINDAELRADGMTNIDYARLSTAKMTTVQSINYNSPFEIVLSIVVGVGSVGSAITVFGGKLLTLHDRWQHSRLVRAQTNVQVAAYELLLEEVESHEDTISDEYNEVGGAIASAARALSMIDNIELRSS